MTKEQEAALQAGLVALGVASGTISPWDGAKKLTGLAVDMIPVDQLKQFLTERDRIGADLAADVAEEFKLEASK